MRTHWLHRVGLFTYGIYIGLTLIGLSRLLSPPPPTPPTSLYHLANWHELGEIYARAALTNRFQLPENSAWENLETLFTENQRRQLQERTHDVLPANAPIVLHLLTDGVMTIGMQLSIGPTTDWRPIIDELEKRMRAGGLRDPYAQVLFIDLFFTSFWDRRVSTLFPRQPPAPVPQTHRWRRT